MRLISFTAMTLGGVLAGGLAVPAQAVARAPGLAPVVVAGGQRAGHNAAFRITTKPTVGRPLAALAAGSRRYGTLTGVIIGAGGRPLARACVVATGASGGTMTLSRASGRYVLAGLRPGRYTLRFGDCSSPGKYLDQVSSADVASPGQPASPKVVPGQVKDLPTITLRPANPAAPPAVARPSRVRGTAAERSGTGQVRGTVTGAGRPAGGVCVQALPAAGGSVPTTTTSASGRYVLSRVPVGRYQVEFAGAFGCHNPGNWLSQWYRGITSPFPTRAAVVRVASGKVTRGIDASLRRGAEISGLVTSRAGKPLRGICVTVQGRVAGGFTEAIPRTGRHGRYVVHGVFKGRYIVSFRIGCGSTGNFAPQWWRYAATQRAATPVRVAGARKLARVDAVLDPGSAIAGVVRASGPAGQPLRGICVDAYNSRSGISASARTGKTGRYTLAGLAAGTYAVQYQAACGNRGNYLEAVRTVTVLAGRTRRNVDVFLQRGAAVTGTVTNTKGKALAGICVLINGANGGSDAETNPDGSYSATGLSSGRYTVQFSAGCGNTGSYVQQYYNGEPTAVTADPVTLTAGHVTTGVDATMQPGGTVTGTLTDSAGHRLSGVCVGIASLSDELFGDGTFTDIEFTSNGSFRAMNLSPGAYRVNFGCGIGPFAAQWFRSQPSTANANLVSVPSGQITSGISGILRPAGTITGTVAGQAGRPLSGICVIAVHVGDPYPAVIGGSGTRVSRHGLYRIGHLAAGRYDLQFSSCRGGRYGSQWYAGKRTQGSGMPVSVRFGHVTAGIDARMRPGGTISGRVVTSAAQPAARYCVEAFDAATESFALAFTDRTGRYTIPGLSSGSYQIFISSCRGSASTTRPGLVRVAAPHAVTGIDERLPAGGSLSGTVTAGMPTADPQSGICVLIVPVQQSGSFGFRNTAANGRYRVAGLTPGSYQVSFGDPFCAFLADPNLAPQWFDDQPAQATADQVSVTAHAQTGGVDATLKANGTVAGLVTDEANAPVPGECVIAFPLSKMPDPLLGEMQRPEFAVTSDKGSYTLAGMQPGRYKIEFTTGCGSSGFAAQWWDHVASPAAATVIAVLAGTAVTGIDASLRR